MFLRGWEVKRAIAELKAHRNQIRSCMWHTVILLIFLINSFVFVSVLKESHNKHFGSAFRTHRNGYPPPSTLHTTSSSSLTDNNNSYNVHSTTATVCAGVHIEGGKLPRLSDGLCILSQQILPPPRSQNTPKGVMGAWIRPRCSTACLNGLLPSLCFPFPVPLPLFVLVLFPTCSSIQYNMILSY